LRKQERLDPNLVIL